MKLKRAGVGTKVLVLILLVAAITTLLSLQGQVRQAEEDRDLLSAQVQQQQEENAALADAIVHSDDPEYLADIARIKLGLLEPDEIEFVDTSH
ncbi:MAG TPA: septum formation initiator family protein [Candidatus Enterenecus stercoripullorum]|nr:septum formation initiator family protein [Candidatus Enterenecus stercoripullorum]